MEENLLIRSHRLHSSGDLLDQQYPDRQTCSLLIGTYSAVRCDQQGHANPEQPAS